LKVACKIGGNKLKCQSKNVELQIYFSVEHKALRNVYDDSLYLKHTIQYSISFR